MIKKVLQSAIVFCVIYLPGQAVANPIPFPTASVEQGPGKQDVTIVVHCEDMGDFRCDLLWPKVYRDGHKLDCKWTPVDRDDYSVPYMAMSEDEDRDAVENEFPDIQYLDFGTPTTYLDQCIDHCVPLGTHEYRVTGVQKDHEPLEAEDLYVTIKISGIDTACPESSWYSGYYVGPLPCTSCDVFAKAPPESNRDSGCDVGTRAPGPGWWVFFLLFGLVGMARRT